MVSMMCTLIIFILWSIVGNKFSFFLKMIEFIIVFPILVGFVFLLSKEEIKIWILPLAQKSSWEYVVEFALTPACALVCEQYLDPLWHPVCRDHQSRLSQISCFKQTLTEQKNGQQQRHVKRKKKTTQELQIHREPTEWKKKHYFHTVKKWPFVSYLSVFFSTLRGLSSLSLVALCCGYTPIDPTHPTSAPCIFKTSHCSPYSHTQATVIWGITGT